MIKKNNIKLEEINKENPFKVPDNYFENFSIRMTDKISEKRQAKTPSYAWIRPKYAVAFVFAGIALIITISIFVFNPKSTPLSSQEMVEAYKYSAIQELSDEQIAQIIAEKQVHQDTTSAYQKDVIDYLSKENIDINTIIEAQ